MCPPRACATSRQRFYRFLETERPDVLSTLAERKELNDEIVKASARRDRDVQADLRRVGKQAANAQSTRDPPTHRFGSQHQADHPGDAVCAASKLKRAQDSTLQARPYADKIDEVLADLAAVLGEDEHPLLAKRSGGTRLIVLMTSDRGLAGSLNTNTIRHASEVDHRALRATCSVVTVGRKGHAAMRRAQVPIAATFDGFGERPDFASVVPAGAAADRRLRGRHLHGDRSCLPAFRVDARPASA